MRFRSLVFTHTPRTAGSSFHKAFHEPYGPGRWFVVDSPYSLPSCREQIDRAASTDGAYVGGHFTLQDVQLHTGLDPADTMNVSIVREPLERVVSLYFFMLRNPAAFPHITGATSGKGFEYYIDYVEDCAPELLTNAQCYHLSSERSFMAAARSVTENYEFVADIGRLQDIIAAVTARVRSAWAHEKPALPPQPENTAFAEWKRGRTMEEVNGFVSATMRQRIERLLEQDRSLHQWILEEHGGFYRACRRQTG